MPGPLASFALSLSALRAREAEPSAAANPARALGRAAGDFFLTDWLAAAAVAAASEVGGQLRQLVDRNSMGPVNRFRYPHARARGWAARCCSTCSIAGGAVASSFSRNCCWQIPVRGDDGARAVGATDDVGFGGSGRRRWCRRRAERSEVGGHRQRSQIPQH